MRKFMIGFFIMIVMVNFGQETKVETNNGFVIDTNHFKNNFYWVESGVKGGLAFRGGGGGNAGLTLGLNWINKKNVFHTCEIKSSGAVLLCNTCGFGLDGVVYFDGNYMLGSIKKLKYGYSYFKIGIGGQLLNTLSNDAKYMFYPNFPISFGENFIKSYTYSGIGLGGEFNFSVGGVSSFSFNLKIHLGNPLKSR